LSSVIPSPDVSQQVVPAQATSAGPAAWRQTFQPNWQEFQPVAAFYCLPGILGILTAGLLSGHAMPALVAASGALAVGFGAFQVQFRHPRTPMIAVTIGASMSAGIGTLANAWLPAEALCTALWGIGLGLMNLIAPGPGWLALQGAIALVIAASFPATPRFALYRFLLVLGGATFQLCVILTLRTIAPKPFDATRNQQPASVTVESVLRQAFDIVAGRRTGFGHALTAGLAVTLGDLLAHWLQMANGYWIAMTVLLVLRPDVRETATRVATRLAGTVLGVGLVTLLTALLRPPPPCLVVLIGCDGARRVRFLGNLWRA
jgi:hypothetical protein